MWMERSQGGCFLSSSLTQAVVPTSVQDAVRRQCVCVRMCLCRAQENSHLQVFVPVNKFAHIFHEKI